MPILSIRGPGNIADDVFRYDLTRTFEVLVGKKPNQQRFTVYHDLLTQRSEFSQAARSERWNHDPTKPTILDDVSEEVFSAYLHCVNWGAEYLTSLVQPMLDENDMYQEETGDSSGSDDDNDDNDDSDGDDSKGNVDGVASDTRGANEAYRIHMQSRRPVEEFLVDLYYLLADKLIDPTSANLAIDELISVIEKRNQYLGAPMVRFVYESTTAGSPLRMLTRDHSLIDEVIGNANSEHFQSGEFLPSSWKTSSSDSWLSIGVTLMELSAKYTATRTSSPTAITRTSKRPRSTPQELQLFQRKRNQNESISGPIMANGED